MALVEVKEFKYNSVKIILNDPDNLNAMGEEMAEEFKKGGKNTPPSWHSFVKTGAGKERPPVSNDWWYIRTASVLRRVALLGPIGVSKLRVHYGNNKNRGHKPEKFYRGSGNILRKILQQL